MGAWAKDRLRLQWIFSNVTEANGVGESDYCDEQKGEKRTLSHLTYNEKV